MGAFTTSDILCFVNRIQEPEAAPAQGRKKGRQAMCARKGKGILGREEGWGGPEAGAFRSAWAWRPGWGDGIQWLACESHQRGGAGFDS